MNQSNSSKQVLLSVIGVAILVVAVVGVSFAFFNYTRTGAANTVTTGQILFNSSQTQINVLNAFPMSKSTVQSTTLTEGQTNQNFSQATVTISGNTNYTDGLDFRITTQSVSLAAGSQVVPISVLVTASGDLTNVGSEALTYGAAANEIKIYSYEPTITNNAGSYTATGVIQNGSILAEGHIANTNNSVAETITIKAFIDADKVAISDTISGEPYGRTTQETGYTDASNGTTSAWVNGRYVLSTQSWNNLATSPATFTIRVEAIQHGGVYAYPANSQTGYTTVPLPSANPRTPS
jgi:hypothetical protein